MLDAGVFRQYLLASKCRCEINAEVSLMNFCVIFIAQRKHEVERIRQQFPNKIPVCNFSLHTHHYIAPVINISNLALSVYLHVSVWLSVC